MTSSDGRSGEAFEIRVIDPDVPAKARPNDAALAATLQAVMDEALVPSKRDDRFAGWSAPDDLVLAVAERAGRPIAVLGGGVDRGRLQLDGLMSQQVADRSEATMLAIAMYRSVEPSIERLARTSGEGSDEAVESIELWAKPETSWLRALADHHGFAELRALHQLRCSLPVESRPVATRPFVPGQDEELLLRVNNRAFVDHPDQGGMTQEDLASAAAQPWFNPDGIRLYEDPDDPTTLAGFCWTKIHNPLADGEPMLGEIYAIGIDPDHHGKGLGVPMTAAGLTWLADQGLTTGMLYVEADNAPAIRTYEKLGFTNHRTDRAWIKRAGSR